MLTLTDQPVPIAMDEHGVARVGGTRIPLETVVGAFNRGASPEEIVHAYPILRLSDIYRVVSYIIDYPQEVADYMKRVEIQRAEMLKLMEQNGDLAFIREKLLMLERERS